VLRGAFNVVKRLSGGDQHFFWRAAAVGTGAAKVRDSIIATDSPARRAGPVTPIPALPPPMITTSYWSSLILLSRISAGRPPRGHLLVMVEVIDLTTIVAMSNCGLRLRML
jgi:hypothetical protein